MRRTRALVVAFAVPAAALAGAACAAVLAIDERELDVPDGAGSTSDAPARDTNEPSGDGGSDVASGTCDPACIDAGGSCDGSTCVIDCIRGCTDRVTCPPSGACHVVCGDGGCSSGVTCRNDGGCKIDCLGDFACHRGVTCEAPTCAIDCAGPNACRNDPGVLCDAAVCKVTCSGASSCNRSIFAQASSSCEIACVGSPSCTDGFVQCLSPEAGIRCIGVNACNDGIPYCAMPDSGLEGGAARDAGTCAITCGPDTTSCVDGYCCAAKSCNVVIDSGVRTNLCP